MEFNEDESFESDQGSVFREAPAQPKKSGQLALMTYSHKKPGRLAARLLMKMRSEVSLGLAGADYMGREKTPAMGQRANHRTQRELRTLMVAIDLLARLNPAPAADVLCQRVKALERASMDAVWAGAQFLELIPSENVSLLDRDEQVYRNKEMLLEQKLHRRDQGSPWKGGGARGDQKGLKGRGKGAKSQKTIQKVGERPTRRTSEFTATSEGGAGRESLKSFGNSPRSALETLSQDSDIPGWLWRFLELFQSFHTPCRVAAIHVFWEDCG